MELNSRTKEYRRKVIGRIRTSSPRNSLFSSSGTFNTSAPIEELPSTTISFKFVSGFFLSACRLPLLMSGWGHGPPALFFISVLLGFWTVQGIVFVVIKPLDIHYCYSQTSIVFCIAKTDNLCDFIVDFSEKRTSFRPHLRCHKR